MARSRKKTAVSGNTTADSEKQDKRLANRTYRSTVKQLIKAGIFSLPLLREMSNVWNMDKDGKRWHDPETYPKVLRK
jgi:hypothetical protein